MDSQIWIIFRHTSDVVHESGLGVRYAYIDGSVQDCSLSIVNTLEILQSCTKPSISSSK